MLAMPVVHATWADSSIRVVSGMSSELDKKVNTPAHRTLNGSWGATAAATARSPNRTRSVPVHISPVSG